ncbi:hypothetical protein BCR39DRAFT_540241 [Naematelia encephala]|uniref:DUF1279 domain-containing protein n=1 Tax=Naematelia encephala TaxID=71784 RepID=A0A1Y2AW45_9TREE|nr:hypothetical protein BCR39DRAFT_540241 [Naematelia encephala]
MAVPIKRVLLAVSRPNALAGPSKAIMRPFSSLTPQPKRQFTNLLAIAPPRVSAFPTGLLRTSARQSAFSTTRRASIATLPTRNFSFTPTQRAQAATALDSSPSSYPSSSSSSSKSSSSSSSPPPPEDEPTPTSAYARFKLLTKRYGWWALGMYLVLSVADFSLTFFVVHSVGLERIEPIVHSTVHQWRVWRHGETETLALETKDKADKAAKDVKEKAEGPKKQGWGSRALWAEVALAYTIHKIGLLPLRAGLTVAWTPKLVNWLASRGWVGKVSLHLPIAERSQSQVGE